MNVLETIINGYTGYANYLWHEITHPSLHNYFWALVVISLLFFFLEVYFPWRKNQAIIRKDFWLDTFYMFFNFFIFSLIIYNAASDVVVNFFNEAIKGLFSVDLKTVNPLYKFPFWAVLIIGFLVRDFIQWWTHRLLHRIEFLWRFHQVHHSVEQMGFAAHLRYHWMETVVYRTIEYLPLALLGLGLYDFFIIHIFSLIVGHYNHSNLHVSGSITGAILHFGIAFIIINGYFEIDLTQYWSTPVKIIFLIGWTVLGYLFGKRYMKILFNNPEMHLYHHMRALPSDHKYGVNFGLSLAIWDYLFGTAHVPKVDPNVPLGFPGFRSFPKTFWEQFKFGFQK